MTPIEILDIIAPEFNSVNSDVKNFWIEHGKKILDLRKFRKVPDLAVALFAAHKMKLSGLGNIESGSYGEPNLSTSLGMIGVASFSEGDSSISFGGNMQNLTADDAEYGLTVYGMQYLDLRRRYIFPIAYG